MGALNAYVDRSAEPELVRYEVLAVGGTETTTAVTGTTSGVTIAWVSTGRYRLTWNANPGTFCGINVTFQATTPGDVKGMVAVAGVYPTSASTYTLDIYCYDGGSLHDLAAVEWLNATVKFKRTTVAG